MEGEALLERHTVDGKQASNKRLELKTVCTGDVCQRIISGQVIRLEGYSIL
jgi:hypothetical protein